MLVKFKIEINVINTIITTVIFDENKKNGLIRAINKIPNNGKNKHRLKCFCNFL